MQVGYPGGVAQLLDEGAGLSMCQHDLPLQYKANYWVENGIDPWKAA